MTPDRPDRPGRRFRRGDRVCRAAGYIRRGTVPQCDQLFCVFEDPPRLGDVPDRGGLVLLVEGPTECGDLVLGIAKPSAASCGIR